MKYSNIFNSAFILCFSLIIFSCNNLTKKESIVETPINKSNWTKTEEKAFFDSCLKEASVNPNYTELEIKDYCNCTLNQMMSKYNEPTSSFDRKWANEVSENCLFEATGSKAIR